MRNLLPLFVSLLLASSLFAQLPTFQSSTSQSRISPEAAAVIGKEFSDFERVTFDEDALKSFLTDKEGHASFTLGLGDEQWTVDVEPFDPRSEDYVLRIQTENGIETRPRSENMTYRGFTRGPKPQEICFTIVDDFVYGLIAEEGDALFFQSLWLTDPSAPAEDLLLFRGKDGILPDDHMCGADELNHESHEGNEDHKSEEEAAGRTQLTCFTVEIAIASDFSMFQAYGSNAVALEARNAGVMAFVNTDYSGQFADDYIFSVVEQFVTTVSGTDPWTASTSASALLNDFTGWGGGGFSSSHDLGQLWTRRNFNGPTIGVAWVGGLCGGSRYHVLQDFTTNADLTRVLVSHEIGHNFNSLHDAGGSPFIMAPSVQNTSTWSSNSIGVINAFGPSRNCLSSFNCGGPTPPVASFTGTPQSVCQNQQVTFSDQSTNADSWSWTFPGATPSTSTDQNPTVTYTSPGTHDVTLTVTNAFGTDTETAVGFITVNPLPLANFTAAVVAPLVVEFDNLTVGATGYSWSFGDGNFSNEFEPIHTYSAPGTYNIVLTAFNSCGQVASEIFFEVLVPPTASFTSTAQTGCAPHSVTFTSTSTGVVDTYSWSFPGGTPSSSTSASPTVVYSSAGTFDVELIASNSTGGTTSAQVAYITVVDAAVAGFSESISGTTVTITDASSNADTYLYDFGDGNSSTDASPTHTYSMGGTYTITQTVTNICGSVMTTRMVTISSAPVASFNTVGEVCFGAPVTLTSTSTGTVTSLTYEITRPDATAFSSSQDPFTFTPTLRGSYDVTLTVSNSTGQTSSTQNGAIVVINAPTTTFSFSTAGQTVTFAGEVLPVLQGATATYSWDFGDGGTSSDANPLHTYAAPGTYTVSLTAFNGCEAEISTQTITVGSSPNASISRSPSGDICPGDQVTYTATVTGTANSITWDLPGASNTSPTGASVSVTYAQSGTFDASVEVCNALGCNTTSSSGEVTVQAATVAAFTVATQGALGVVITNNATNGTAYSYDFGDGNSSSDENPSHTYSSPGTYTIEQTVTGPCNNDVTTSTVTVGQAPTASFTSNPGGGSICPGETVSYTSTSTAASSFSWSFPGGTPSTSTDQNVQVVYASAGSYDVSLEVTNALGTDTETQTNYIVVEEEPTAAFGSSVSGLTVSFNDQSSNATSYAWDFGDGNSSSMSDPTHTYASSGTYTVTLEVTNTCGTDQSTASVTVLAAPVAEFSNTTSQGCAPHSISFDASGSTGATSVAWSFPGGTPSTSTDVSPTVVYNTVGSYDVTLTVSNSTGTDSETTTNLVVIDEAPTALFTSSINALTATFTNQSTGGSSYAWDFGDGSNTATQSAIHTYTMSGTYTVNLDVTNACGTVRYSETITVLAAPVAAFSQTITSGCAPLAVTYDASTSTDVGTLEWSFPGGTPATSTDPMPTVMYAAGGTFSASLTVTNATGTDTEIATDLVVVAPLAVASFNSDVNMLSVDFTSTSTNANTYSWDFGNGMTSSEVSPTVTYTTAGTYTVTLTVTNACGQDVSTQSVVVAEGLPNAEFSISETSGCAPLMVRLTDETTGSPTAWSWTVSSNTGANFMSTDQNPVFTLTQAGVYTFTLEATNAAGSTTEVRSDVVTVFAAPTVLAEVASINGLMVTFDATLTDADAYIWDFGDGNTSNIEDPLHTYAANGTYTITLTATNDCGEVSGTTTVTIMTSGVGELPAGASFNLFPNPTGGNTTWSLSGVPSEPLTLTVTDVLGREVIRETLGSASTFRQNLSLENWAAGVYVVRLKAKSYEHQVRVVKQ
ncbi:MAG: PKD domain-containing protein [Saprospiraceae bacterium]